MSKSEHFKFIEKEDVPFAIERATGLLFRMDGRSMGKWVEIEDPDAAFRIESNASPISESEAMLLADEMEADIASLGRDNGDDGGNN